MTLTLIVGDLSYSSWSMRAGLLHDRFDLPLSEVLVDFLGTSVADQLAAYPPARTVPTLVDESDGSVIWESLAVAEELASRFPTAGLWPSEPGLRALARSVTSEMHAGFGALRTHCPMNLRKAYADCAPPEAVSADMERIEEIWGHALARSGGPWLAGGYSIADAFYAPVAARIAGYGLSIGPEGSAYVARHLADPAFRRWRARGFLRPTLPWYQRDYPPAPWPGPASRPARAVAQGPSVNATCPFSGKPVAYFAEVDGIVLGFCNAGCRDKVVADAEAWPEVAALLP